MKSGRERKAKRKQRNVVLQFWKKHVLKHYKEMAIAQSKLLSVFTTREGGEQSTDDARSGDILRIQKL
jgi:hypothetical protein